jgi:hypothetical protein
MQKQEILDTLAQANETECYHQFSPFPGFPVITDGVLAMAMMTGGFWLLDLVGSYQGNRKLDKNFQVWKLKVNLENQTAVVRGYNDTKLIVTQKIPYTDFPLDEIKLYLMDGIILLPGEY